MVIVNHDYSLIENSLNLDTLENRRNMAGILFIHKLINGNVDCSDLVECINLDIPSRTRRNNSQSFHIPFHRTNYGQNSPIDRYCKLINSKRL